MVRSDFLKGMPTSWDETNVLEGIPGEYILIARRTGKNWYVGAMSLNKKHVTVTTDFLDDLDYRAIVWCDATDSDLNPRKLIKKELFVNRNTDIDIDVVSNGGFVAIFTP